MNHMIHNQDRHFTLKLQFRVSFLISILTFQGTHFCPSLTENLNILKPPFRILISMPSGCIVGNRSARMLACIVYMTSWSQGNQFWLPLIRETLYFLRKVYKFFWVRYFWNSVNLNFTNSHLTVNHIILRFNFFNFSPSFRSQMKLTSQEKCKFFFFSLPTPWGVDHKLNQAVWCFYCPLVKVSADPWNEIFWGTVLIFASWYLCLHGAINMSSNSFWNELMNNTTQTFTL